MNIDKVIKKYGLKAKSVESIDLSECYIQATPNNPLDDILSNDGQIDYTMKNSPHTEIARLFFEKGEEWLRTHYKSTKYYRFHMLHKNQEKFPNKIVPLFKLIESGYLKKGYRRDYIVVLLESFAKTRYNIDIEIEAPEIFIGHHRAGARLALGKPMTKVLVAEDAEPGSCFTNGKIHHLCIKKD